MALRGKEWWYGYETFIEVADYVLLAFRTGSLTPFSLTISSRPQTLWGLTKWMAQDGANRMEGICAIIFAVPKPGLRSPKVPMVAQGCEWISLCLDN